MVTEYALPGSDGPVAVVAHGFAGSEKMMPGYALPLAQAGYLAHPSLFDCARTDAGVAREWTFWLMPHQSLLVPAPDETDLTDVIYCPQVLMRVHEIRVSGAKGL